MSAACRAAFFELHRDLPCKTADVAWAAQVLNLAASARPCDAACGPGEDIPALLQVAPKGHVTALDKVDQFVDATLRDHGNDPRVTVKQADMESIIGPYDLIWCAGAVYFLGTPDALTLWRKALVPNGALAISQPCWFTHSPSPETLEMWTEYPAMTDAVGIDARIIKAGFGSLSTSTFSDTAWEDCYRPLDARIAQLRPGASGAMTQVPDEAKTEVAGWQASQHECGYPLSVVVPL